MGFVKPSEGSWKSYREIPLGFFVGVRHPLQQKLPETLLFWWTPSSGDAAKTIRNHDVRSISIDQRPAQLLNLLVSVLRLPFHTFMSPPRHRPHCNSGVMSRESSNWSERHHQGQRFGLDHKNHNDKCKRMGKMNCH